MYLQLHLLTQYSFWLVRPSNKVSLSSWIIQSLRQVGIQRLRIFPSFWAQRYPVLKVSPVFLQRETVVSSALRSIWSCAALVGFWAVAPHTQLSFPSIWSNADCRCVSVVRCLVFYFNVTPHPPITRPMFDFFKNAPICMREMASAQLWSCFSSLCIDSHDSDVLEWS